MVLSFIYGEEINVEEEALDELICLSKILGILQHFRLSDPNLFSKFKEGRKTRRRKNLFENLIIIPPSSTSSENGTPDGSSASSPIPNGEPTTTNGDIAPPSSEQPEDAGPIEKGGLFCEICSAGFDRGRDMVSHMFRENHFSELCPLCFHHVGVLIRF